MMMSHRRVSSRRHDEDESPRLSRIDCTVFRNGDVYLGHMKSGKINGLGYFLAESPAILCVGEWHEGMLNGVGMQLGPGKQRYVGEFLRGDKNGVGTEETNETVVIGNFLEGEVQGFCIVTDKEKHSETQGHFKDGQLQGFGKIESKDKEYSYCGHFENGKYCGLGLEIIRGGTYTGEFKVGKRDGIGAYSTKESSYYGEWRSGERSGFGIEKYQNSDNYQGFFNADLKNGIGRYSESTSGSVYVGHFKDGLRHGFGHLQISSKSFYLGDWLADRKEGTGILVDDNGRLYYGQWKKNQREGRGIMIYPDSIYRGDWWADRPHGRGIYKGQDDHEEKFGIFEYGILTQIRNNVETRYSNFIEANSYKAYLSSGMGKIKDFDYSIDRKMQVIEDGRQNFREVIRLKNQNLDSLMRELKTRVDNVVMNCENKTALLTKEVDDSEHSAVLRNFKEMYQMQLDPRILTKEASVARQAVYQSDRKYDKARSRSPIISMTGTKYGTEVNNSRRSHERDDQEFNNSHGQRHRDMVQMNKRFNNLFDDVFGSQTKFDQRLNRESVRNSDFKIQSYEESPRRLTERPVEIRDEETSTRSFEERTGQALADLEEKERLMFVEKMALKKQKEEILMLIDELNALKARGGVHKSELNWKKEGEEQGETGLDIQKKGDKETEGGEIDYEEYYRDQKELLEEAKREMADHLNKEREEEALAKQQVLGGQYVVSGYKRTSVMKPADAWEEFGQKYRVERNRLSLGDSSSKFLFYEKLQELILSAGNLVYRIKLQANKPVKIINVIELPDEGSEVVYFFDLRGRFGMVVQPAFEVIFVDLFDKVYKTFDPYEMLPDHTKQEGIKKLGRLHSFRKLEDV